MDLMDSAGVFFALGASLCWGTVPVIYKLGMGKVLMEKMNAIRSFGFLASSLIIYRLAGESSMGGAGWVVLLGLGLAVLLANVAGDLLFFIGIDAVGVGKATAVTCSYPLFVTVISVLLLGESVTLLAISATVAVIVGLVLLRSRSVGQEGGSGAIFKGVLASLGAAFLWGGSLVVTRWAVLESDLGPAALNLWRAIFFLPIAWGWWGCRYLSMEKADRPDLFRTDSKSWVALVIAGALALSVGGFFITRAMMLAPASLVSPIAATSPLIATIWGRLLFSERLSPSQILGVFLIIAGSVAISL
ncbi:MAG: DMT family transporter [Synergistota bacterium]|nr:DMT family transporter [Synergistota bacterium]